MDDETMRIIKRMLCISPLRRPSCQELLADPYFADLPSDYVLDIQKITGEKITNDIESKVVLDLED